jgi:hypothetical protein
MGVAAAAGADIDDVGIEVDQAFCEAKQPEVFGLQQVTKMISKEAPGANANSHVVRGNGTEFRPYHSGDTVKRVHNKLENRVIREPRSGGNNSSEQPVSHFSHRYLRWKMVQGPQRGGRK